MKDLVAFGVGLVALTACSSGGFFKASDDGCSNCTPITCGGCGAVIGTVAGYPLNVTESTFTTTNQSLEHPAYTVIMLSDRNGLCNGSQGDNFGKNLTFLGIDLFALGWHVASPVQLGAYNLNTQDPVTGSAQFWKQDDQCQPAPELSNLGLSATGSLVLESIRAEPGGSVKGTFNITMRSGDRITGAFDAAYCPVSGLPSSFKCGY